MSREGRDDQARRAFAVRAARATFDGLELTSLDPDDEDERALLIRAEHPELAAAIKRGDEEIEVDGQSMNPRLHLTIHEIIAKQLAGLFARLNTALSSAFATFRASSC